MLHGRPWRDTSQLLDLLVRDRGRVRAVAKGVRGGRRKSGGNPCQPFRPLLVSLRGRGELQTLTQVETHRQPFGLCAKALFGGLYANEVLVRALTEAEPCNQVFIAYEHLLGQLAEPGVDLEPPLRRFEGALLGEMGYAVDFTRDGINGAPLLGPSRYAFIPQTGFVPVDKNQRGFREAYRGDTLLRVGQGELQDSECRRAAKQVMRLALRELIGDKPLLSRSLFASAATGAQPSV